jgi:2,3-dihydroxybenzoate decarboxylase
LLRYQLTCNVTLPFEKLEVEKNPTRFGALAALSMHDPHQAAQELTRAVKELGMFGGLVNDFQSTGVDGSGKEYYDTEKYLPFWAAVQELDVPIYFHPRWPPPRELELDQPYGSRKHLLGAAVSFHLDLSFHIYAMCASGLSFLKSFFWKLSGKR